jgi:hypothetical protein
MKLRAITRQALEQLSRELLGYAIHKLGKSIGVTLFVFDFGDRGNCAYISNSNRDDMIGVVKEWLAREEAGLATDPPGPRGEG